ncbi:MAG: hypothetical protein DRH26_05545, partial [Deltaproteobacteria bacterium]
MFLAEISFSNLNCTIFITAYQKIPVCHFIFIERYDMDKMCCQVFSSGLSEKDDFFSMADRLFFTIIIVCITPCLGCYTV